MDSMDKGMAICAVAFFVLVAVIVGHAMHNSRARDAADVKACVEAGGTPVRNTVNDAFDHCAIPPKPCGCEANR